MRRQLFTVTTVLLVAVSPLSIQHLSAAAPISNGLLVSVDASSGTISGSTWSPSDGTSYSANLQSSSMYTSPNTYVTFGDSTNQYADFGDIGSYSGDISGEAWVYINTMHLSGWNIIASKWFTGSTEDWHFGYYLGALRICYRGVCPTAALSASTTAAGAWHHVAFTFKQPTSGLCSATETGGVVTLYMDGAQVAQDTAAGACHPTSSTMKFVIGDRRGITNLGIDGRISKFRFFTRALSANEVTQIFSTEGANYGFNPPPINNGIPTVAAPSPKVGLEQVGSNGSWINNPTSFSFKWYRSATANGTYTFITGATSATYTPTNADYNQYLKFEVTGTNSYGSNTALSNSFLILSGTPSLAISGVPLVANYRTTTLLTISPGSNGKVQFISNGKRISNCVNLIVNSSNFYTATCAWSPSIIGFANLQAKFTSSNPSMESGTSSLYSSFVRKRTSLR